MTVRVAAIALAQIAMAMTMVRTSATGHAQSIEMTPALAKVVDAATPEGTVTIGWTNLIWRQSRSFPRQPCAPACRCTGRERRQIHRRVDRLAARPSRHRRRQSEIGKTAA
jgi:hypothetical protein